MAALFDGNRDNVMAAMFDGNGDNISPNMAANGNYVSPIMAATIDLYSNYIFPRCYVDELPEDLLFDIFIRLPMKSLVVVMSVCKHWYVLINDPSFRCRHLQFQKMVSNNSGHFLLLHHQKHMNATVVNTFLFDGKSITDSATTSSSSSLSPSSSYRNILHFSPVENHAGFEIDGPVNGLYCLYNENGHSVIWNPATNEFGFLPVPQQCIPIDNSWERYFSDTVVGFGTDPLDQENYKVVLITKVCDAGGDDEFVYLMIYTTRTNTWRLLIVEEVHYQNKHMVVRSLNNTCLNGFYYWKVANKCTAIVFDMSEKEEKAFRDISTPCDGDLALHEGHITMFFVNKNLNEVDVWVMLEETNNHWLKKISVRGIQEPVVKSLGFWKTENEMLIVIDDIKSSNDTQTVLYNTTTREIKNIGPRGDKDGFRAFVYYETIESLTGGITKCEANDSASFLDMIWDFFVMESPVF